VVKRRRYERGMKEGEIKAKLETARAALLEGLEPPVVAKSLACHWKLSRS